jgi:rhamnosyltransferase
LLATYNGEEWIRSQISTIQNQVDCDVHIYIRDDGSTDQTLEIIKALVPDSQITFVNNCGIAAKSAALNFFKIIDALNFQNFDYIAFADQDDIWFPNKIIEGIKLIKNTESDGYSSNLIAFDNNSIKSWVVNKKFTQRKYDYLFQGASAGCTYILKFNAIKLIKKVMANEFQNLPIDCSHDWIIYAICRSHGLRWVHDERSFIAYRQHYRNIYGAKNGGKGLVFKIKMIHNGWYKNQILYLKNFIQGSDGEAKILLAIKRLDFRDKLFLIIKIGNFRRELSARIYLALSIIAGII